MPSLPPPHRDDPGARRVHPVQTNGTRFEFEAALANALRFLNLASTFANKPIMREFLEPIGRADTLSDLNGAIHGISAIIGSIKAMPPVVEFPGEDD